MYFTDNYTAAQPTEFHGFLSHKSRDFPTSDDNN